MPSSTATVEIVRSDFEYRNNACSGRVLVRRDRAGVLAVIADIRHFALPAGPRWGRERLEYGEISSSEALRSALIAATDLIPVSIDWSIAVKQVAEVDWLLASVLAKRLGDPLIEVPRLPAFEILRAQRTIRGLRAIGAVAIEVEWGYEKHDVSVPFDRWLRALSGSALVAREPYIYDGERFVGEWEIEGTHLRVGYGDGGVGWIGDLEGVDELSGPQLEGVDVAALTLMAAKRPPLRDC